MCPVTINAITNKAVLMNAVRLVYHLGRGSNAPVIAVKCPVIAIKCPLIAVKCPVAVE